MPKAPGPGPLAPGRGQLSGSIWCAGPVCCVSWARCARGRYGLWSEASDFVARFWTSSDENKNRVARHTGPILAWGDRSFFLTRAVCKDGRQNQMHQAHERRTGPAGLARRAPRCRACVACAFQSIAPQGRHHRMHQMVRCKRRVLSVEENRAPACSRISDGPSRPIKVTPLSGPSHAGLEPRSRRARAVEFHAALTDIAFTRCSHDAPHAGPRTAHDIFFSS